MTKVKSSLCMWNRLVDFSSLNKSLIRLWAFESFSLRLFLLSKLLSIFLLSLLLRLRLFVVFPRPDLNGYYYCYFLDCFIFESGTYCFADGTYFLDGWTFYNEFYKDCFSPKCFLRFRYWNRVSPGYIYAWLKSSDLFDKNIFYFTILTV